MSYRPTNASSMTSAEMSGRRLALGGVAVKSYCGHAFYGRTNGRQDQEIAVRHDDDQGPVIAPEECGQQECRQTDQETQQAEAEAEAEAEAAGPLIVS